MRNWNTPEKTVYLCDFASRFKQTWTPFLGFFKSSLPSYPSLVNPPRTLFYPQNISFMCFTCRGRVKADLRNANISSSLAKPCPKEILENWELLFASCCWPPHPSSAFVYLWDQPFKSGCFLKKSFFNNRFHPQFFNKNTTIQFRRHLLYHLFESGFLPNTVRFRHFFWRRAPVLGIKFRFTFSWET